MLLERTERGGKLEESANIIDFPNLGLTYIGGWCLATYKDETPITRPPCGAGVW